MLMSYAQVRADESALEEVVDPIEAVYALLTSHGVKARIFAHNLDWSFATHNSIKLTLCYSQISKDEADLVADIRYTFRRVQKNPHLSFEVYFNIQAIVPGVHLTDSFCR